MRMRNTHPKRRAEPPPPSPSLPQGPHIALGVVRSNFQGKAWAKDLSCSSRDGGERAQCALREKGPEKRLQMWQMAWIRWHACRADGDRRHR